MTCSTIKRLTKPLDEPKREFQRLRKAAMRSHQNESLAIAGRTLFNDEASFSNNTGAKLPTPPKTLYKHSRLNSFRSKNEDPLLHVKHYLSIVNNIQAGGATRDTSRLRVFHFSLAGKATEWLDRMPLTQITTWDRLIKEAKKDDEDERLLSIFKQIHISLPFLEAMIHKPKGAKVLKDLLSHKEKLEKTATSVKLSEECYAIIQRSMRRRPSKSIFPIDFVVLEMDEDELVSIILGRPFFATARAVIEVREGKSSLRVGSETITFNIKKSMKSKHSRDDYLYYADHTVKLVQEQWVKTVNHDRKWTEEEEEDFNKALAVSFYPRMLGIKCLSHSHCQSTFPLPASFRIAFSVKPIIQSFSHCYLEITQSNNNLVIQGSRSNLWEQQVRRNDVKARTTLLLALPDEHQLRFSKYKTAQELCGAILKTFGGNEATKKTKKNQLKQQYDN
nr:hypothetical protein [Tanacetum cinerariifolium]